MIVDSVLILGGTGFVFATFIALANRKLKVWEDPRIDVISAMLPQANCGACGLPGCRAFAEKLVAKEVIPAKCSVSSPAQIAAIAAYLRELLAEKARTGSIPLLPGSVPAGLSRPEQYAEIGALFRTVTGVAAG